MTNSSSPYTYHFDKLNFDDTNLEKDKSKSFLYIEKYCIDKWIPKQGAKVKSEELIGIIKYRNSNGEESLFNLQAEQSGFIYRKAYGIAGLSQNQIVYVIQNINEKEKLKELRLNATIGKSNKLRTKESCSVYLMHDTTNNFYKIGISNKPKWREKTLQSEKPTIELLESKRFVSRELALSFEKALHQTFDSKRIRGEWFNLTEEDVKDLISTLS